MADKEEKVNKPARKIFMTVKDSKVVIEDRLPDAFERIIDNRALRHHEAEQAIWHTKAFRQFCQSDKDRVKKDLDARLQTFAQKPESDREIYEQGWLETPPDEALGEALKRPFSKRNSMSIYFPGLAVICFLTNGPFIAIGSSTWEPEGWNNTLIYALTLAFPKNALGQSLSIS